MIQMKQIEHILKLKILKFAGRTMKATCNESSQLTNEIRNFSSYKRTIRSSLITKQLITKDSSMSHLFRFLQVWTRALIIQTTRHMLGYSPMSWNFLNWCWPAALARNMQSCIVNVEEKIFPHLSGPLGNHFFGIWNKQFSC